MSRTNMSLWCLGSFTVQAARCAPHETAACFPFDGRYTWRFSLTVRKPVTLARSESVTTKPIAVIITPLRVLYFGSKLTSDGMTVILPLAVNKLYVSSLDTFLYAYNLVKTSFNHLVVNCKLKAWSKHIVCIMVWPYFIIWQRMCKSRMNGPLHISFPYPLWLLG